MVINGVYCYFFWFGVFIIIMIVQVIIVVIGIEKVGDGFGNNVFKIFVIVVN